MRRKSKVLSIFMALGFAPALTAQLGSITLINDTTGEGPVEAIAPGSIFQVVSGQPILGPTQPRTASGFPLQSSLAGTSVRVTVGRTAVDAFILETAPRRIRAMLPSQTPLGEGQVTVTYSGNTTPPVGVRVAARRFELYRRPEVIDSLVGGPAMRQAEAQIARAGGVLQTNLLSHAAHAGELIILWGTGLGAAGGDESRHPVPGDMRPPDMEVLVGGRNANIRYAGRSGCCAGVDQIVIELPPDVEGCYVPVHVRFRDTSDASEANLAISAAGEKCPDLPPEVLEKLDLDSAVKVGFVGLGVRSDLGTGEFAIFQHGPLRATPPGVCRLAGTVPEIVDLSFVESNVFDAGPALIVTTPVGFERWHFAFGYVYGYYLPDEFDPFATTPQPIAPVTPGEYTVQGAGGFGVGPFEAKFLVPPSSFAWTNRDDLTSFRRADEFTITWTGADAAQGYVSLMGTSRGNQFYCVADAAKESFTVPAYILSAGRYRTGEVLNLSVSFNSHRDLFRFEAPGMDFAYAGYQLFSTKSIPIE